MSSQPVKPVTLTQVASVSRKAIMGTAIALVIIVIGRFFLDSLVTYWVTTHPAPPPPPTHGFGILPKIAFPIASSQPTSYRFEVTSDKLQPVSDRAKVFFMPTKRPSLLALDKAKKQAQTLGFLLEPQQISSDVYRWSHTQPLPTTLDYSIVTGTFTMKMDWQSDPTFLQVKALPIEDTAIDQVRSLLSSGDLLEPDIATAAAQVTYLKASGNDYATTVSLSESDFLQVDIMRNKIDSQFDVVTPQPGHGIVRAIITGKTDPDQHVALLEYHYLPIDYSSAETYPIISPSDAASALKAGKGYTASMPDKQTDVVVRNIHLGYFDSFTQQDYLQPIYIFEGDGGYVGYIPAVASVWQAAN